MSFFSIQVRTVEVWDEVQGADTNMRPLQVSGTKGHRVGVPPAVPADRPCAESRQNGPLPASSPQQLVDTDFSPQLHHAHGVTASHVDQVGSQDAFGQVFSFPVASQQFQAVDLAIKLATVDAIKDFTVLGIVTAGRGNKKGPGPFPASQANDEAVDGQGLPQGQLATADGNDFHRFMIWFSFHDDLVVPGRQNRFVQGIRESPSVTQSGIGTRQRDRPGVILVVT